MGPGCGQKLCTHQVFQQIIQLPKPQMVTWSCHKAPARNFGGYICSCLRQSFVELGRGASCGLVDQVLTLQTNYPSVPAVQIAQGVGFLWIPINAERGPPT